MLIPLNTGNYKVVEEGKQTVKITKAELIVGDKTKKPKSIKVTLSAESGGNIFTNYTLDEKDKFIWLTGVFITTALGLKDGDNFDTDDVDKLVGHKLLIEVVHTPDKNDPDKFYANVKRIISNADGEIEIKDEDLPFDTSDISPRNMIVNNDLDLDI